MPVQPSYLTSEQRDEMQELYGLCWNTDDDYEDDMPDHVDIISYHNKLAETTGGHWYLPDHGHLRKEWFATELAAYEMAKTFVKHN